MKRAHSTGPTLTLANGVTVDVTTLRAVSFAARPDGRAPTDAAFVAMCRIRPGLRREAAALMRAAHREAPPVTRMSRPRAADPCRLRPRRRSRRTTGSAKRRSPEPSAPAPTASAIASVSTLPPPAPHRRDSEAERAVADRIAELLAREAALKTQIAATREEIDRALVDARRILARYRVVALRTWKRIELPKHGRGPTRADIESLCNTLRQRSAKALARVTAGNKNEEQPTGSPLPSIAGGAKDQDREETIMSNDPVLRRRIIEEYGPPDEALDGPPELLGDDLLDAGDDEYDEDLDDRDQDEDEDGE